MALFMIWAPLSISGAAYVFLISVTVPPLSGRRAIREKWGHAIDKHGTNSESDGTIYDWPGWIAGTPTSALRNTAAKAGLISKGGQGVRGRLRFCEGHAQGGRSHGGVAAAAGICRSRKSRTASTTTGTTCLLSYPPERTRWTSSMPPSTRTSRWQRRTDRRPRRSAGFRSARASSRRHARRSSRSVSAQRHAPGARCTGDADCPRLRRSQRG
jgi:hypothetical protein